MEVDNRTLVPLELVVDLFGGSLSVDDNLRAPNVNSLTSADNLVSGNRNRAGSTVSITVNDELIGGGQVDILGWFSIIIPTQPAGTVLSVTATCGGITSEATRVTVAEPNPGYVNYKIYVNGNELHSVNGFYQSRGIVLGSVRELAEAMGISATWDAINRQMTLSSGSDVLIMTVNSTSFTFNGIEHELAVAPLLAYGRTLVPMQSVVEAFGGTFRVDNTVIAPNVNEVDSDLGSVTGDRNLAGSTICVMIAGTKIGECKVYENGSFCIGVSPQNPGTILEVTATYGGVTSEATRVTVIAGHSCWVNYKVYVNGNEVQSDNSFEESYGTVLVPARSLADAMLLNASWDATKQQITFSSDDITLTMTVYQPLYTINGVEYRSLISPPMISDGKVLVPLQAVAEIFGCTFRIDKTSTDATLCELDVGAGSLYPAFAREKTHYEVSVPSDVESINLKATANESHATLSIDGKPVIGGQLSEVIPIPSGSSKYIVIMVTSQDGTTGKIYTVTVKRATRKDLSSANNHIVIGTAPVSVAVPADVTNAGLVVVTSTVADKQQATLPLIEIKSNTSLGEVKVLIPQNTVVSGPNGSWNGNINVPSIKPNNTVSVVADTGKNATVNSVIEIGYGDVPLTFDRAVRILVPGQAGKDAGYYRGSTFTKIDLLCGQDDQAWADANIPSGGDGKIDVDSDLVIWTKHFTKFIAYTQTTVGASVPIGGGGGGGGSLGLPAPPTGTVISSNKGGTVSESGVTISIPGNAINKDIRVNVNKVTGIAALPLPVQSQIIGSVWEITKDQPGNFDKAVTLYLPIDPTKIDINAYDIGIYWLDDKNQWVILNNAKIDAVKGYVSGEINHFTKFAILAKPKAVVTKPDVVLPVSSFNDIAGNYAENSIRSLASSGVISGYSDGSFKPHGTMSRAEFATLIVKAFKLENKNGKVFNDTADHWGKDAIATANAWGIITGYNSETFGPDDMVTREQMAVMIVKAGKLQAQTEGMNFADSNKISVWAVSGVNTASSNRLIAGFPDKTFRPQSPVTRAEAAVVVYKAVGNQ